MKVTADFKRQSSRAIFLDRDGVINVDHGYVCSRDRFEFIDGIFDLVRFARDAGFLVFVVTNQAGIGRGYYSSADFRDLTDWMLEEFKKNAAPIDKVYFCPYYPADQSYVDPAKAFFRKPQPGMILQAAKEFEVDLGRSILVGDKSTDIEAGVAAGIGCNILFRPSEAYSDQVGRSPGPDAVIGHLRQVPRFFGFTRLPTGLGSTCR
jgi:D-glycero-D-manno-heptose 1,7-bisphosphate phosphatase